MLVAATGFAALLVAILKSGTVKNLLTDIVKQALNVASVSYTHLYVSRMQSACRYVERNPMPQQDHLTARLVVDDDFEVAPVNNRLFLSLIHICTVYGV